MQTGCGTVSRGARQKLSMIVATIIFVILSINLFNILKSNEDEIVRLSEAIQRHELAMDQMIEVKVDAVMFTLYKKGE